MAARPKVAAARTAARQDARKAGSTPQEIRQAGRTAAQGQIATNRANRPNAPAQLAAQRAAAEQQLTAQRATAQEIPQPPAGGDAGTTGYYEYTEPVSSQLSQPYQDAMMSGALGALPSTFNRFGQQGQMADLYGQGAATNLGGAQAGMNQLTGLGGQAMGASGQLLSGAQQGMNQLQGAGSQATLGGVNALLGAQGGMQGLQGVGGQATDLTGGTLGQYGQLMNPNLQIQQGLAGQIQAIQGGKADFDPYLTQQANEQERLLREQLRRNLGPDYETSSAGMEALSRFNQKKDVTLGSAQFNRLGQLVGMQQQGLGNIANTGLGLGGFGQGVQGQQFGQGVQGIGLGGQLQGQQFGQGMQAGQFGQGVQGQQFGQGAQLGSMYGQQAGQLYDQAMGFGTQGQNAMQADLNRRGQMQQLYGNIPQTMAQFGQAMSGQAGAAVGGQQPYQQDRQGQFAASQFPTKGGYQGQMMAQSGDRWAQIGSSIGGMGGGQ